MVKKSNPSRYPRSMSRDADDLVRRKAWFLDRDGTLSLSNEKLPGADRFLARLKAIGASFFVLTNNSSKSPRAHHRTLRQAGFDLEPSNVLVSIEPALAHLRRSGYRRLHCLANREVLKFVASQGFELVSEEPDALLLTYDTELDYAKLETFTVLLNEGRPYFATHIDVVCPTPRGGMPDAGTFIEMFRMATGRMPAKTFGKPEPAFLQAKLDELGLTLADAVMVGDRLYTDIEMGRDNDLLTILVLTGETTREAYEASDTQADLVAPDLDWLTARLDRNRVPHPEPLHSRRRKSDGR
jgi:HAD superfamily hydrolase (TIGR01450 family)